VKSGMVKMGPWFVHRYPYGVGPFNHGVSHLAFGLDGMLYVSSGSRTDGGEAGKAPGIFTGGEVEDDGVACGGSIRRARSRRSRCMRVGCGMCLALHGIRRANFFP